MTLEELGQLIRQKREQQGISIEEIASNIKVSARTLKAIEGGSLDGLPHAVYSKGFIRSFGLIVGIEENVLNDALLVIFPPERFDDTVAESSAVIRPIPSTGFLKRIVALLLLVLVVVGIVVAGWFLVTTYGDIITDTIKKPFSAVNPIPESTTISVASASLSALEEQRNATIAASIQQQNASQPSLNPPVPVEGEFAAQVTDTSPPSSGGVAVSSPAQELTTGGDNTVLITAQELCYLRYNADSTRSKEVMLQAGNVYSLQFTQAMQITLGNAGGVTIDYNGKSLGVAGAKDKKVVMQFPLQ